MIVHDAYLEASAALRTPTHCRIWVRAADKSLIHEPIGFSDLATATALHAMLSLPGRCERKASLTPLPGETIAGSGVAGAELLAQRFSGG